MPDPVITDIAVISHEPDRPRMQKDDISPCISRLMATARQQYQRENPVTTPEALRRDRVVRLSTNEFFFYTDAPLERDEFARIDAHIRREGARHHPGIQLALGSFAVKDAHNRVMNVTPYVICGRPTQVQYIVKNYPSEIDLRCRESASSPYLRDVSVVNTRPSELTKPFTFNNVVVCPTPGGDHFLSVVDVCLDHEMGVGKGRIMALKRDEDVLNLPVSHLVTSHSIRLNPENSMGAVMHTDSIAYSSKVGVREGRGVLNYPGRQNSEIRVVQPHQIRLKLDDIPDPRMRRSTTPTATRAAAAATNTASTVYSARAGTMPGSTYAPRVNMNPAATRYASPVASFTPRAYYNPVLRTAAVGTVPNTTYTHEPYGRGTGAPLASSAYGYGTSATARYPTPTPGVDVRATRGYLYSDPRRTGHTGLVSADVWLRRAAVASSNPATVPSGHPTRTMSPHVSHAARGNTTSAAAGYEAARRMHEARTRPVVDHDAKATTSKPKPSDNL